MKADLPVTSWVRLSLLSFCVAALFGVVMRYKIAYEFPWLSQKNLQHAHSHFAFAGWVTQILMVYIVSWIREVRGTQVYRHYAYLLWAHLIAAYGMLVSFSIQGYGTVSITFSTLTVLISYVFAAAAIRDMMSMPDGTPGRRWFVAALVWSVLSSLGTFSLAYLMATKQVDQHWYLGSVYYYLHFQYNGWFFFACAGLLIAGLHRRGLVLPREKTAFLLLAAACIPAFFLSILWAKLPVWLYLLVVVAAGVQLAAWYLLTADLRAIWSRLRKTTTRLVQLLLIYAGLGLTLKLLLQFGSTVPEISKLAFGYRPIVIAYLHLVLLAITSVFLIAYVMMSPEFISGGMAHTAVVALCIGIFFNEVILAAQGILGLSYTPVPYSNEMLFYVAVVIMLACIGFLISQWRTRVQINIVPDATQKALHHSSQNK